MERQRLVSARHNLLRVHRALLDEERIRYERERGRVEGGGALLQLVIHDPWFLWLRPVSELIVQIDELLEADEPLAGQAEMLLGKARHHLRPDAEGDDYQQRYHRLVQEAPAVAVAHAGTRTVAGSST